MDTVHRFVKPKYFQPRFKLYFIGFVSAPVWSLVTGYLMQEVGFKIAFSTLAFSYLAGVLLMFLVTEPKRPSSSPAAA